MALPPQGAAADDQGRRSGRTLRDPDTGFILNTTA